MTYLEDDEIRVRALEFATSDGISGSLSPAEVVERAQAYYDFITAGYDKTEGKGDVSNEDELTADNTKTFTANQETEFSPITVKVPGDLLKLFNKSSSANENTDIGSLVDKVLAAMDRIGEKGGKR